MKRNHLNKLTGLSAALLFSAGVMAGEQGASFEKLDENKDGKLTASEVSDQDKLRRQWVEIDQDNSGAIDQSEFSAFEEQGQEAQASQQGSQQQGQQEYSQQGSMQQQGQQGQLPEFGSLDQDGNDKLTPREVSGEPKLVTQWTEIDQDSSGTIEREEFSAFEEEQKSGGAMASQSQDFESLDQNSDGELSPTEASQQEELSQQWTEVDQDNSGTIDQSEFSAFEEMSEQEPAEQGLEDYSPEEPQEGYQGQEGSQDQEDYQDQERRIR